MAAISFRCTSCNAVLKVAAEKAGRKAKCNRCGAAVTIPAEPKPASEPAPIPLSEPEPEATYGVIKEAETQSQGTSAEEAFAWSAGKAKKTGTIESDLEEPEKKKPPIIVPKGQEPAKRKLRTTHTLTEPERWHKVMIGLKVLSGAMSIGILVALLPKIAWLLASAFPEYASIRIRNEDDNPNNNLEGATFFMALFTGPDHAGAAVACAAIAQGLALLQGLVLLGGYVICLAVPPKFGTTGQVFSLLGLGAINLLLRVAFWLLPLVGIGYVNLPLLVPEVVLITAGTDRVNSIMTSLMTFPLWESFLAIILILIQLAEPVVLGNFIRSIGLSMKDELVEGAGMRLVKLTLGQGFMLLAYYMAFLSGSSNVLQWVLFVLYWLAWGFWLGTVIYFALILFWTPTRILKELAQEEEEEE